MWRPRCAADDPAPSTLTSYARAQALRAYYERLQGSPSATLGPLSPLALAERLMRASVLHVEHPLPIVALPAALPLSSPALDLARLHTLLVSLLAADPGALP